MREGVNAMTSKFELKVSELPDGHLMAEMMIDGDKFGDDFVDLSDLKMSAIASGAYDLQTCGCGTPECAGFWEPIFVRHEGDVLSWEFDSRYHPIVLGDEAELSVTRYEFNRTQYIEEIRTKFEWLRSHPNKDRLGPYGFNSSIFDEDFPNAALPGLPFIAGSTIVVGYAGEYQQPWVWVEGCLEIQPRQLLPTGSIWASFAYWSLMWDSKFYDLGQCAYKKDDLPFQLRTDVSVEDCNQEAESLAKQISQFWNGDAEIIWEQVVEAAPGSSLRHELSRKAIKYEGISYDG